MRDVTGDGPTVRLAGEDHDGTIDRYELGSARRALALLKTRLGRERLLELLHAEIAAGEDFLRAQLEASAGREATGTTELRAHGIGAAAFGAWLAQAFGREDVLLAGHPEHYSIHASGGRVNIVETLGEHVCSFFLREWDADAAAGPVSPSEDGAQVRRSRIVLDDGTAVGSVATAFLEEADGFTARLSVTLPETCAPEVVDQHLEHFAVEFRTWILTAAAETAAREEHVTSSA